MIEVLKDHNGAIIALLTWQLFNEDYVITEEGHIFGLLEIFIHERLDGKKIMKYFAQAILPQVPQAERCVYFRDGKPRTFKRKHFERMART